MVLVFTNNLYPMDFKMHRDSKGVNPREHIPNRFQVAVRRQVNTANKAAA